MIDLVSGLDGVGSKLLDDIKFFIARFCVFPDEHSLTAVTLWPFILT